MIYHHRELNGRYDAANLAGLVPSHRLGEAEIILLVAIALAVLGRTYILSGAICVVGVPIFENVVEDGRGHGRSVVQSFGIVGY
jgi:hypothetical protein